MRHAVYICDGGGALRHRLPWRRPTGGAVDVAVVVHHNLHVLPIDGVLTLLATVWRGRTAAASVQDKGWPI